MSNNNYKSNRKPYNKSGKPDFKRKNDGKEGGNFRNFRENVNSQNANSRPVPVQDVKFKLKGENTLCSFMVLKESDSTLTLQNLGNLLNSSINHIAISIYEKEFESTKSLILNTFEKHKEILSFISYEKASFDVHNKAFAVKKSDIFLITHSGMETRNYAVEILKRYLQKDGNLASVPTIYSNNGVIQKYCVRILTLAMQIKMLFSQEAKNHFIMMERGEVGYYKIHKIQATFAPFAVNSKAFESTGGFKNTRDDSSSIFAFFKNINKNGAVLFVPSARFVQHAKPKESICFMAKFRYFLTNVL